MTAKLLGWSLVAVLVAALVGGTAWWFLGRGDSSEATDAVAGAQLLEVTSGTFGEYQAGRGHRGGSGPRNWPSPHRAPSQR
ncbi:MAG: hypothetical protein R2789_02160 [Microthrixaceae bacterium]